MLLFYPFQNEVTEVHRYKNIKIKYKVNKEQVDAERYKFEPNPDFMDILDNIIIEEEEKDKEEEEGESLEEETTSSGELRDFVKNKGKNVYKDDPNFRLQDKIELNKKINTLNRQQRKIFDEMMDTSEEKQFFLYLYGKAGTGKTYLLNTLIAALEFKSLKSGVDLKNHWC